MNFSNISIIVSEIDGVVTDGRNAIDYMNHILFKTYNDPDFEAIKELKPFFNFVFLSSSYEVSYNVMRNRNIPAYFTSNKEDKLTVLTKRIMPHYEASADNLMYIGSRSTDIPCLHLADIGLAPKDAPSQVISAANAIVPKDGGYGVVSHVDEMLRSEKNKR